MKISEKLQQAEDAQKPYIAFEFYPPRSAEGVTNLTKRFGRMLKQGSLRERAKFDPHAHVLNAESRQTLQH